MRAKLLRPVRPNLGVEAGYRRSLTGIIDLIRRDLTATIRETWAQTEPMATDADPAVALAAALRLLRLKWTRNLDSQSIDLARYFATASRDRVDATLKAALRKAGIAVEWRLTRQIADITEAATAENVALIRSIPAQYFDQIEGAVMRSVQTGRDLKALSEELREHYGVTRRRAVFIARDQTNKATAVINRIRQQEAGIIQAKWLHSAGGREPRPTHVANSGKLYDIAEGWADPALGGKRIWPGTEINCLPGDSGIELADNVEIAYRRRYAGNLSKIVTEDGKTLRATPNHPVLTLNGWVPIGSLNKGDYVLHIPDNVIFPIGNKTHINNAISMIGDIFNSLSNSSVLSHGIEIGVGGQFHGDITDGNVDVIRAARFLRFGGQVREGVYKLDLTCANNSATSIGHSDKSFSSIALPSSGGMSTFSQPLSSLGPLARHSQPVGLTSISNNTACRFDPPSDRISGDSMDFFHRQKACPVLMLKSESVRVAHVDVSKFDGHVYNLQTEQGWYLSGGIITHNCRCVSVAVLPPLVFAKEAA